jgi:hypothetical protein
MREWAALIYSRNMTSSRQRRSLRREQSGTFSKRLTSEDSVRQAMVSLLVNTERYMIVIRQAPVNRGTRDPQKSELVLFENDELELTDQLDARLRRAREVKILVTDKSRETILVEFPTRSWEVVADGPDIRNRLLEFSDRLTARARSRIFSTTVAQLLILVPVFLFIVVAAEWGAVVTSKGKQIPVHHWIIGLYKVIAFGIAPICWITALFALIVIAYSGAWVCGRTPSHSGPLGTVYTGCVLHYLHRLASQPLLVPLLPP